MIFPPLFSAFQVLDLIHTLCKVVEISSKALQETNMRPPEYLDKEKNQSTVCDFVEISKLNFWGKKRESQSL